MTVKTWMPMYWGDYLRDTGHLSTAQHGAYLLLIGHYWTTSKSLPDNDDMLRQVTRMTPAEWKKARPVLAEFFTSEGGRWVHRRIEAEMLQASDKQAKRSARSSAAASARWSSRNAPSMPQASAKQCLSNALNGEGEGEGEGPYRGEVSEGSEQWRGVA